MFYLSDYDNRAEFGLVQRVKNYGKRAKNYTRRVLRGVGAWADAGVEHAQAGKAINENIDEFVLAAKNINNATIATTEAANATTEFFQKGLPGIARQTIQEAPWGKIAAGAALTGGGLYALNRYTRERRQRRIDELRELQALQQATGYR